MHFSTAGADFAWDPEARLIKVHFRRMQETTMLEREAAARAIRAWTREGPYGVLADGEGVGETAPGALAFWAGFFRLSRAPVHIAVVGFPAEQERALRAWEARYGLRLRAFASAGDALAWLSAPA